MNDKKKYELIIIAIFLIGAILSAIFNIYSLIIYLLIGLLIAVIGGATGPLTGFAMNPARDFGPKLFAYFSGWGDIALTGGLAIPYFLVPLIAPIVGGLLGAWGYQRFIGKNLPCNCGES